MTTESSMQTRLNDIVRASHGRLVAALSARSRDIAASEDALSNAYRAALETWPTQGIPHNPAGWLMRVAKNALIDASRSALGKNRSSLDTETGEPIEIPVAAQDIESEAMVDDRLKLMFAAAHPALDESIRAPMIMQTVLNLEATEIAQLFCLPTATMAQRLVRAKTKIRDAGIPFSIPSKDEWPARLNDVLEAVYGAYSATLNEVLSSDSRASESLYLADMLGALLPDEPEALGLAALICFSASRAGARFTLDGAFVPLDQQHPQHWSGELIALASSYLSKAQTFQTLGRFQLEAAIHAVHADRRRTGVTQWSAIVQLYEGLVHLAPTRGMLVSRAYAIGQISGVEAGFAALQSLSETVLNSFAPALICRAHFHETAGQFLLAHKDLERAIELLPDGKEKAHLVAQLERLAAPIRLSRI
jgi:predicted RNA polymerase sigma factor